MEELFLIYVHGVGKDYTDRYFYEFIFSDTIEDVDGEGWEEYPAGGRPSPPRVEFIKKVGKVDTDILFTLVQDNEQFSVWDSIDGVIALGWENIEGLDEYPEKRLTFDFGMPIKAVEDLLYERDITIEFNT